MSEGDRFLSGKGLVHETLARLAKRLRELEIPYAVAGGMALYSHGFRRVTDDIDLIVTKSDLLLLHQRLDGLGYLRPFETSKNLRDVQSNVKIEFLVAGEYPGDGKPKPISFPDPRTATEFLEGLQVLTISKLIELKIASGMTGAGRTKDIGDVEQLVQVLHVPRSMSEQLHEYVRPKFIELWDSLHVPQGKFILSIRCAQLVGEPKTFDKLLIAMPDLAAQVASLNADGITIDSRSTATSGWIYFATSDPMLAKKYDMRPEEQILFEG